MWVAITPLMSPPHACRMPALSMIRLAALRTWMSSNGGAFRFMVMYQVRSSPPDFSIGCSSGSEA